eukprot:CAMPEP_0176040330 /NCGR_PEP_ID=MMETSP0120_2-20121206/19997_1 /TAXON_ID=160619 /ORGANISM="Kryptoperidinium foliaceum, Strain CCMP 1326" /LENGTH=397 /DNA_ID=CAMNT_0017373727 /DNA_START=59 /DNA_END=1252 /DNA_ORIENTATION=+
MPRGDTAYSRCSVSPFEGDAHSSRRLEAEEVPDPPKHVRHRLLNAILACAIAIACFYFVLLRSGKPAPFPSGYPEERIGAMTGLLHAVKTMADPDVDNDHLHNQLVDDDVDGDGDVVDDVDGIDVDGIDYFVNDVVDFVDIDVRRLSAMLSRGPVCESGEVDHPGERTLYMYRAQSAVNYPFENVNAADLPGVLWYLHNEIVVMCPRKYDIIRVRRMKVTSRRTPQVSKTPFFFAAFNAIDNGMCTVPGCRERLENSGYSVGCQLLRYGDFMGHWYSLHGACPFLPNGQKTPECRRALPGGLCGCDRKLGEVGCNYHVEEAGEVYLDEVTGVNNQTKFCQEGKLEYNRMEDRGIGCSFWNGFNDAAKVRERVQAFREAFRRKYPHMPLDLGPSHCEF